MQVMVKKIIKDFREDKKINNKNQWRFNLDNYQRYKIEKEHHKFARFPFGKEVISNEI